MNYIECLSFQNGRSLFILVIFPDKSIDKAVVWNTALMQLKIHCCAQNPHDPWNKSLGITNISTWFSVQSYRHKTICYLYHKTARQWRYHYGISIYSTTENPNLEMWRSYNHTGTKWSTTIMLKCWCWSARLCVNTFKLARAPPFFQIKSSYIIPIQIYLRHFCWILTRDFSLKKNVHVCGTAPFTGIGGSYLAFKVRHLTHQF